MTQRLSVGSKPHPHARLVAAALLSEPAFSWGLPSRPCVHTCHAKVAFVIEDDR